MLEPLGFKIIEAVNGKDGLEKAVALQPDLILSDLLMPVKTGLMMILELKQKPLFANTPIIALSACDREIMEQKSASVGCDAFLLKPFEAEQLMDYIKLFLNLEWVFTNSELKTQKSEVF